MEWVWVTSAVVLAVHDEQIAEHGGAAGTRDPGLLESALARPRNLAAYDPDADIAALAAAYAFGIARNHPFIDGNKRTALVVLELALVLNGHALTATDGECVSTMLALAAGDVAEADLAHWIGEHLDPPFDDRADAGPPRPYPNARSKKPSVSSSTRNTRRNGSASASSRPTWPCLG